MNERRAELNSCPNLQGFLEPARIEFNGFRMGVDVFLVFSDDMLYSSKFVQARTWFLTTNICQLLLEGIKCQCRVYALLYSVAQGRIQDVRKPETRYPALR